MGRQRTSNVMRRLSTLRYEIAKDMTPVPRILPPEEAELRKSILAFDGICEYCRRNKACEKGFGDHFYPIIADKYPTVFCDDDWNRIPACATCNCSKGGRTWKRWFESIGVSNPMNRMEEKERKELYDKFARYDEAMLKHCQKKQVDKDKFDSIMTTIADAFRCVDEIIIEYNRVTLAVTLT